ncbi:hypothetical protein [Nitrosomonas sp. sh817]|uniref:hypothetical protein n=1 Tax=Nitrosomonas sp. sh817 TaxID=3070658 RepID=UPI0027DCBC66|nr:hypothetical protein [Nitrosomonas sp. sh817]WMJ09699.1 hypothetical protein RBH92_05760 [Nitrosomonas sp. sh817]
MKLLIRILRMVSGAALLHSAPQSATTAAAFVASLPDHERSLSSGNGRYRINNS